jgi:hypothetical protein
MSSDIYKSKIWKESLSENSKYSEKYFEQVEILRTSFKNTRKKAEYIAGFIQQSQPELTLHDITHLDALWETAETVGGETLHLNPMEAYVFGCAVLFHDLGMALVLWDEDLPLLKQSKEYKDTLFHTYQNYLGRTPEAQDYEHIPHHVQQTSISALLRQRHAFKAKLLPSHSWNNNGQIIYLIENEDLRIKLGEIIGIIAESHWWDVERIRSEFEQQQKTAAPTTFPVEWKIDNVKLACLLRLADFIHIDDRRATDIGLAILNPKGISLAHWTFQNKLARAIRESGKERLTFQSHTNFKYNEHQAWWLAFNTIRAIDIELRAVDNMLSDLDMQRFAAKGINGIATPQRLSAFLKTEGWEPADTQFKVSDIQNIIEKLGGSHLYGNRLDVPLRELIQNATDALKAKKFYDKAHRGVINVRYYNKAGKEWLEVEDNGIGMTKAALLYGLLDFGNSFWKSALILREHPGLLSGGFRPTGQFGIGFFSVFMIADFIQIISKPVAQGAQTRVIEIGQGLSSNPILKVANKNEERVESGTMVRMSCRKPGFMALIVQQLGWTNTAQLASPLVSICQRIAPALPVDLFCTFENETPVMASGADDWKTIDPIELLSRLTDHEFEDLNIDRADLRTLSKFIRPVYDNESGEIIGRGTILPLPAHGSDFKGIAKITVGGLVQAPIKNITGLWIGNNSIISRNFATPICTYPDLCHWLAAQNKLIVSDDTVPENDKVAASNIICSLGLIPVCLPITFIKGRWFNYQDVVAMDHGDYVLIERLNHGDSAFLGIAGSGDKIYATVGNPVPVGMVNRVNGTQRSWIDDLPGKRTGIDTYDKFVHRFSMLGLTIRAIAASWGINEQEVAAASIVGLKSSLMLQSERTGRDRILTKE